MNTQRFLAAGRLGRGGPRRAGGLRNQQVVDVGGAVFVDDEARVRLQQRDLVDGQGIAMHIGQAIDVDLLPFEEVAALDGVQGVQLVDLGFALDAEGQRLGALEVDVEVAGEHAAAQLQTDERADVGLGHTQVDIAGADIQPGRHRRQVDLPGGLQLALLADAGIELEREGRLVEAVEALQVEVQRADVQRHGLIAAAVGQVHDVVAQLYVLEQHLPGLAWLLGGLLFRRGRCGCRFDFLLGRGLGRLAGEQFLPIELAVLFQCRPGFELVAADLADGDQLLGQVDGCLADLQLCQARQLAAIRGLDGEGRDTHRGVVQPQLGLLGEVERVVGVEADHAVFQHQRHGVAHIGPEQLHLAVGDLQRALRGERRQAEGAVPVDTPTVGTVGYQGHVGIVVGQRAEVLELQVHVVIQELDRLARALVLEMQVAFAELDTGDAQRERVAWRRVRLGLAGRQLEQLGEVERTVLGEQHFAARLVELHRVQVQRTAP
ncbi:hypothetical protein D3C76_496960 [compost metagenome]